MRLVWFVLAGFLLGFSISTLWEWLYFRRRRFMTQVPIEQETRAAPRSEDSRRDFIASRPAGVETIVDEDDAAPRGHPWEPAYQGPGVYLESEDADEEDREEENKDKDPVDVPVDVGEKSEDTEIAATRPPGDGDPDRGASAREDAVNVVEVTAPPKRQASAPRPAVARTSRPAMPEYYRLQAAEEDDDLYDVQPETGESEEASPGKTQPEEARGRGPTVFARAPRAESAPEARSPASRPAPVADAASSAAPRKTANYPDDLAKIKGIGEVYKLRLYAAGIYTWHQIAQTDEETLRAATQAYPSSNVDEWAEQAQKLAEKHGRTGAVYTGPQPNDLTRIYGIGPVGAATLYRAGICTYAQLAAATPESLAPLFPIAVAGDEPDFAHWIAQAQELSQDEA